MWTRSSTQPALWTSNTTVPPSRQAEDDVGAFIQYIYICTKLFLAGLLQDVFNCVFECLVSCFLPLNHPEMSCLMEALQDKRVRLQPECKKRLQDRIDMWSYAAKVNGRLVMTPTKDCIVRSSRLVLLHIFYYRAMR